MEAVVVFGIAALALVLLSSLLTRGTLRKIVLSQSGAIIATSRMKEAARKQADAAERAALLREAAGETE